MKYNETLISSNLKEVGKKPVVTPQTTKVLISIGAARATAWLLPEDHVRFSPDSFEIIKYWVDPTKITSKADEEFLDAASKCDIVELRYGTYTVSPISSKKRSK